MKRRRRLAIAAGAAQVFNRLLERFNDLFFHTDRALLDVTRDLLVAAQLLDAILKRFQ